jgi:hypothetical protein
MSTRLSAVLFHGLALVLGLTMACAPLGFAHAARPAGYNLLPASTVAYLRIADVQDLVGKAQETSIGRIVREQQIRPLLAQLFDSATEAFAPVEERTGLSLPELLAIPQGELTLALVDPDEGRPAVVLLMDFDGQEANAKKLIDRMGIMLDDAGASRSTESVGDTSLTVFNMPDGRQTRLAHVMKASTLLVTSNIDVAKQLLARWNGDQSQPSLGDNGDFGAMMSRTRGPRGAAPQIDWFVDPIGFFKVIARNNVGAQAGLAVLPVLGLDGLRGIGGSITLATEEYDTLLHVHVLLDDPRSGILAMLAFGEGDTTPEAWVPHDVAAYQTGHWDAGKTLQELTTLYDSFRGEGALEAEIKRRISDAMGVDFHKDLLEAMTGRFTSVMWFEPPARPGSQSRLLGIGLEEAESFRPTLAKIVKTISPNITQETYGGIKYYQIASRSLRGDADESAATGTPAPGGPAQPCVGIVGQYLLIADRPAFLHRAITTQADASKSLANELDFKLIASKLRRQSGTKQPCLLTFQRPEEGLRTLYEMATNEQNRRRLAEAAENNRFFTTLHQSLKDNPLPPFAVFKKYLAPGGGMLTDDPSGLHYTGFGLRRD